MLAYAIGTVITRGGSHLAKLGLDWTESARGVLDLVDDVQLRRVEAVVRKINPLAEILRTQHGRIEPARLLGKERFQLRRAEQHPQWLAEAREKEHTPETIEYGISGFVFRARVPFHPARLQAALGEHP